MSGPSRLVLAIDTATPAVTAGVVADGDLLAERVSVDARAHAERITPNVLAALAEAGLRMADLGAVVVGCGPGPFTGLRVGMATAAAYGHALGVPVHGVCSLDAIGGQTTGDMLVVTDAPPPRGLLGSLSRRRPDRRSGGQRPGRYRPRCRASGGRARPSMRRCSACRCANRRIRHRWVW